MQYGNYIHIRLQTSVKNLSSRWSLQTPFPLPPCYLKTARNDNWRVVRCPLAFWACANGTFISYICFFFTTSIHLHSGNKLLQYLLSATARTLQLHRSYGSGLCYRTEKPLQLQLENQALVELCNKFSFSASGIEGDMQHALHEIFLVLLKNYRSFWPSGGKWNQVEWGGPYEYIVGVRDKILF